MISTCRSETASNNRPRSSSTGRLPGLCTTIRSVPVTRSMIRGNTPMRSTTSIAGRNRSTAWPPVLRSSGARSTTVTSNPYLVSQYARTGPATLAPEIRTPMTPSLLNGW